MFEKFFGPSDNWNGMGSPDRKWKNNNTDGRVFFGYDHPDGTTTYYDSNGDVDCELPTPSDDEQSQNDYGY